jgi:hypothetical protein
MTATFRLSGRELGSPRRWDDNNTMTDLMTDP